MAKNDNTAKDRGSFGAPPTVRVSHPMDPAWSPAEALAMAAGTLGNHMPSESNEPGALSLGEGVAWWLSPIVSDLHRVDRIPEAVAKASARLNEVFPELKDPIETAMGYFDPWLPGGSRYKAPANQGQALKEQDEGPKGP